MTDRSIQELPKASPLNGTELLPIWQSGKTCRINASEVGGSGGGGGSTGSAYWRGARVSLATNLIAQTWPLLIPWSAADLDTDTCWTSTAPTRLTVPNAFQIARVTANVRPEARIDNGSIEIEVLKNGLPFAGMPSANVRHYITGSADNTLNIASGPIAVLEGDYFELRFFANQVRQDEIWADPRTWFALELMQAA